MRFPEGIVPAELPDLAQHLSSPASEAPELFRRFVFLDDPDRASPGSCTIAGRGVRLETLKRLQAGLLFAEEDVNGFPASVPVTRIRDARRLLADLLRTFAARAEFAAPFPAGRGNRIHPSAVVEGVLEGDVVIEAGVFVSAGSFVGLGSRLEANSVVRGRCVIGRNTIIQSGAVVGSEGFGFFGGVKGLEHMPHPSGVSIGNDCFVGANTVIAAGVLHPTEIGNGCKLDSHVQIAHNVRLGKGALLASQAGIAGSTVVGENFRMGGAASVAGHLRIGNQVSVAAKAGVTKDIADGMTVAGFPARPIGEWRRDEVKMRNEK